ncbi:hypothetical protein CC77DRAFT_661041 [Alternaria alternata]|uniref:Uncharacterized protein n=1 Tax=Alternaria alternata TaxID=5599 RepID=A0A177D2D7_ALTAL|nr:hypothetical protein CC77DRAFT_661041 [Alternaria alternata]OAG13601.1 hypothetical protein CC77DRAFT_661041 [Alternaria alternata]
MQSRDAQYGLKTERHSAAEYRPSGLILVASGSCRDPRSMPTHISKFNPILRSSWHMYVQGTETDTRWRLY